MNCPDFTEIERSELIIAMKKLTDAMARINSDLKNAMEMSRKINVLLTDILNPQDEKG